MDDIKDDNIRRRISVPAEDAVVVEWINTQKNLSLSLRELIKVSIMERGIRDYFATYPGEIVQQPKRGRPLKVEENADQHLAQKVDDVKIVNETNTQERMNDDDLNQRLKAMQGSLDD